MNILKRLFGNGDHSAPEPESDIQIVEDSRPFCEFFPDISMRVQLNYVFAHRFLPGYVHQNPAAIRFQLTLLTGEPGPEHDPTRYIQSRWSLLERRAGIVAPTQFWRTRKTNFRRITDLQAWVETVAGHRALFVQMPPPDPVTPETGIVIQAFFVGIVPLNDTAARVFTLEDSPFGNPAPGSPSRGILCEWTANGSHINYGTTLIATREAFVTGVAKVLEKPAPTCVAYTTPPQPNPSASKL